MVILKTEEEMAIMKEGGHRLRSVVGQLIPKIKSGITTQDIENEAIRLIAVYGGQPSFKQVKGYNWSICLPINEQIVHTPPSQRIIKKGDLVTLDIGFLYKGFHTDFATTILVEDNDKRKLFFLKIGKSALEKAIDQARPGNFLGQISSAIEQTITKNGFFIIKELTGHGIGRNLHEDPFVLGFLNKPPNQTLRLKPGLTIAIEVIYSMSTEKMVYEKGGNWSLITADKSLSACFEHAISITKTGNLVLT